MDLTRSQISNITFGLRVARNQVLIAGWDGYMNDIKRIDLGIEAIEQYQRGLRRGCSTAKRLLPGELSHGSQSPTVSSIPKQPPGNSG